MRSPCALWMKKKEVEEEGHNWQCCSCWLLNGARFTIASARRHVATARATWQWKKWSRRLADRSGEQLTSSVLSYSEAVHRCILIEFFVSSRVCMVFVGFSYTFTYSQRNIISNGAWKKKKIISFDLFWIK